MKHKYHLKILIETVFIFYGFPKLICLITREAAKQTSMHKGCGSPPVREASNASVITGKRKAVKSTLMIGRDAKLHTAMLFIALLLAFSSSFSQAIQPSKIQRHHIDIPQLNAAEALNRLAEQTDVIMLFPYQDVKAHQANTVVGKYTLMDALDIMLEGSGLVSGLSENGSISISIEGADGQKNNHEERKMNIKTKKSLLATFVAVFGAVSHGASAQGDNDAATGQSKLDEIIVTAQKREESLQEVPISIAVLGGNELDSSRFEGVKDALRQVAGVHLFQANTGDAVISIRGVASGALFAGSGGVGYYIDEVPYGFVKSAVLPDASPFDLERVEVLRGPQGTLYGANALNGVVRIMTKDANLDEVQFKMRSSTSTTSSGGENYRGDVVFNAPVIPGKLAARAVIGYNDLSGWIDKPSRNDANDLQLQNYRLKVNAQPVENLSVALNFWHADREAGAPNISGDDGRSIAQDNESISTDYDIYGVKITYDFPSFSLFSSSSYMDYSNDGVLDLIAVGAPISVVTKLDADVFAQEIRLSSLNSGLWNWSVGGLYRDASDSLMQGLGVMVPITPFPIFNVSSESVAIFGEVARSFFDEKVKLAVGLRYFEDKVSGDEYAAISADSAVFETDLEFDAVTPRVVLSWYPEDNLTVYGAYSEGFRSGFDNAGVVKAVVPDFPNVEPDTIVNYEVGAKGIMLSGRLAYDIAVYYVDWVDIQSKLAVTREDGLNLVASVNGESASGAGLDLGLLFQPTDGLRLGLNIGWNDITQDSDVFSSGFLLLEEGGRANESVEYTAGLTTDYTFSIGVNGFEGRFASTTNYSSAVTNRTIRSGALVSAEGDDFLTTDLSFSITSSSQKWTATAFLDNATNENGALRREPGIPLFTPRLRPRTVGLQFEYQY